MVIEESVLISSTIEKVWETFTDLTCWIDWNTVMRHVEADKKVLSEETNFECKFYPFSFPVGMRITVDEVIPYDRLLWSVKKPGLYSRHEFFLKRRQNGVLVTSRETFTGFLAKASGVLLPKRKMEALTKNFLNDLKKASER